MKINYLVLAKTTPPITLMDYCKNNCENADLVIIDNTQDLYYKNIDLVTELKSKVNKLVFISNSVIGNGIGIKHFRIPEPLVVDNLVLPEQHKYQWYSDTFEDEGHFTQEFTRLLEEIMRGQRNNSLNIDDFIISDLYTGSIFKVIIGGLPFYLTDNKEVNYLHPTREKYKDFIEKFRHIFKYADLSNPSDRVLNLDENNCLHFKTWLNCEYLNINILDNLENILNYIHQIEKGSI